MNVQTDATIANTEEQNPWRRCAVRTAIIGAGFSFIVLVLMTINYVPARINLPRLEAELLVMKEAVGSRPDDEQLLLKIRLADLQFRHQKMHHLAYARRGGYLLLGGIAVFLVGVKWAGSFKKKLPARPLPADERKGQVREARWGRWAVTTGVVILAAGVLLLMMGPSIDLTQADGASVSSPWASFRGPGGQGISTHANVPTDWDGETGRGILWKTKVPLPGNSSPVVWGDRVFLSGGDPNDLQVYGFDADSGDLLWTGDVTRVAVKDGEDPYEPMPDTGFATPTVVTNGRWVCAIFVTGDVGCFDFNGRKIWEKSLGIPESIYGYAASLATYKHLVLVQFDQGGAEDGISDLIALDGFSGNIVWKTKRPVANSWSSPIVTEVGDAHQLITCADPWVIAYDPANGAQLWQAQCLAGDIASTPIYANGMVFVIEPYTHLAAIRADGRGDVTKTHIAWINEEGGPDICSPVSDGENILLLGDGLLCCHKTSDGTKLWEEDLRAYTLASPNLVGDSLYLLDEDGVMHIAEYKPKYKELVNCKLGEKCHASPAFADGRIYIRGMENLYCIGSETKQEP
ncbi:MAG: outer membrane protein assembly factor BamB family protein [Planctomycetota bacterium]|jgi:outer membrane protein assembly factor BamB